MPRSFKDWQDRARKGGIVPKMRGEPVNTWIHSTYCKGCGKRIPVLRVGDKPMNYTCEHCGFRLVTKVK